MSPLKTKEVYKMTFGEQLKIAQMRSGKTREDIKHETGYSLPTIRKVFEDKKDVTVKVLEDVARCVGVKRVKYIPEF